MGATPQDNKGLLPPVSTDRNRQVARIRASLASGDLDGMQKVCDEMIREEPANFEGYFWMGFLDLQRENGYDAVRFLRRAEALDANPYVVRLLAVAYYTLRQFRLFTLKMNEALQKQPEDFAAYYYLGRYFASNEVTDFDRAAEYFQKAIERNPKHFHSHYYLGYCYEVKRKLEEAERRYQQAIEYADAAGAQFVPPYQGIARLRLLENRPADALTFANRAVEIAPRDAESHKALAKAYEGLKRQAEAIHEWEQVATLDPTDASPYYHLYRIYLAMGDDEKANSAHAEFERLSSMY